MTQQQISPVASTPVATPVSAPKKITKGGGAKHTKIESKFALIGKAESVNTPLGHMVVVEESSIKYNEQIPQSAIVEFGAPVFSNKKDPKLAIIGILRKPKDVVGFELSDGKDAKVLRQGKTQDNKEFFVAQDGAILTVYKNTVKECYMVTSILPEEGKNRCYKPHLALLSRETY